MKSFVYSVLAVSFTSLAACQSSGVAQSDTRTIDLPGQQARTSIEIPQNVAMTDAPYALQGNSSQAPAMPTGSGYQAR